MMRSRGGGRPICLAVGAVDSSCGAGIGADLAAIRAAGARPTLAVTAATVQDRRGVRRVDRVGPAGVRAQIIAAASIGRVGAWKTGALVDAPTVRAVAAAARRVRLGPLVCDPVIAASAGGRLLDAPGLRALVRHLLPAAALVTPNAREAEILAAAAGRRIRVRTAGGAAEAGRAILALGPRAVLVTGGHASGRDVTDVLVTPSGVRTFRGRRLAGARRGSGCTLAAGIAARLAAGDDLVQAIRWARAHVRRTWTAWP